jgi:hypothetical protein
MFMSHQGLFARRNISPGELVAMYSGLRAYDYDSIFFKNMTLAEREDRHKNQGMRVGTQWGLHHWQCRDGGAQKKK